MDEITYTAHVIEITLLLMILVCLLIQVFVI